MIKACIERRVGGLGLIIPAARPHDVANEKIPAHGHAGEPAAVSRQDRISVGEAAFS